MLLIDNYWLIYLFINKKLEIIILMSIQKGSKSTITTQINISESNSLQKSKVLKKLTGNSQFIRSKFDADYNPQLRVFNITKNTLNQQNISKRQKEKERSQQLSTLIKTTQQQVKSGKKIIIDWSQKSSFRTTRFPSLGQSLRSKKSVTQQNGREQKFFNDNKNTFDFVKNASCSSPNKQITSKSDYLRQLIAQSIRQKKQKRSKIFKIPKSKSYFAENRTQQQNQEKANNFSISNDPHLNFSLVEEIQKKQKQFFKKNNTEILQAIDYQCKMSQSLKHTNDKKNKNKFQQIHQRIMCKSKLTLLKSDLARKFKQIRDILFQQAQQIRQPSPNNAS